MAGLKPASSGAVVLTCEHNRQTFKMIGQTSAELMRWHGAMHHKGPMTPEAIAEILQQAAIRLSRSYFEEVERERDGRWDDDNEQADNFRDEAEEIRNLAEECRAAAAQMLERSTPARARITRSTSLHLNPPH